MKVDFRHSIGCLFLKSVLGDINRPSLNYQDFGNQLGILGDFDSLSYYNNVNDTQGLSTNSSNEEQDNNEGKLFIRDSNHARLFANTNGQISNLQLLSDDTILINGNFTDFNDESCQPPIIYNITSEEITSIFTTSSGNTKRDDLPKLDGQVKTTFIDGDLIYIGGDFTYKNSSSVVIYNQTSKELIETPFKGFGNNSLINAITKVFDSEDVNSGSIIFGGKFDTLGIPELLQTNLTWNSNSTNHTNTTNTSLITAEQILSLKHGIFTDVNGDGSDASKLICSSTSSQWSPQSNSGGQWLVELPNQMKGLTPTKARLYIPEGDDSIKLFRIYSYPNNGIMNLTYVDPTTNELKYCDAWCPLSTLDDLNKATGENIDNYEDLMDSYDEDMEIFIDEQDGSYSTYYEPSTKTRTLSYGKNFQEFAFENEVAIDKIGITVISWYGSKGSIGGFELYSNSIVVYGNETLNEPNCDKEVGDTNNLVEINSGDFKDISTINPSVDAGYMVSTNGGKVTMYPNITYSGDYSIIMLTPGCIQDNSCDSRSIVNVTVFDTESNVLSTKQVWQNNDYDKFDYLFYGHLDGSTLSDGQNRIEIEYDTSIAGSDQMIVIDKIKANIVELDSYYDMNSTNHTRTSRYSKDNITEIKLNGLFEYSLSNFSNFDINKVFNGTGDDKMILETNTYVGNSSLNVLSSELNGTITQFNLNNDSLMILGDFDSVINLNIEDYNTTSNSSVVTMAKRSLRKREDIFGGDFNTSITKISNYYDSRILLGKFQVTDDLMNLANDNKSVSSGNNFVGYEDSKLYTFNNDFINEDFDSFTNVTIKDIEYFVFSSSSSGYSKTWDNTNKKFADEDNQLNVTQVLNLPNNQQIISGTSFEISDISINDIAFINKTGNFTQNDFKVSGEILQSYYINSSVSVIGGKFEFNESSTTYNNIAFLRNDTLQGIEDIKFDDDSIIQTLYVDSNDEYLIIGYNGSVEVNGEDLKGGVIIYDLKNKTVSSFQPAELSTSKALEINSIVLYNEGNKLLVGGNFENAGSLDCSTLCIYDIDNTRWESPTSGLSGNIKDLMFIKTNEILIAGDLTFNGDTSFVTYDIKNDKFNSVDNLNDIPTNSTDFSKVLISDDNNDDIGDLKGKLLAYGKDFIIGFDGSKWSNINGISGNIKDMKIVSSGKSGNDKYFGQNNVLLVSGQLNLDNYGLVNLAIFDGSKWYPWIYSTSNGSLGTINSILIKDEFRLLSSEDIKSKKSVLSSGKVVGISLACALGSITLLSLLYIIPYFLLFRRKDNVANERIGEREMMNAVNPQELFHEIDLQRNH